jgi:DNA ligase-1
MSLKPDMNTDQILGLMDQIAATSGKNDKIAMLKAVAGDALLQRVLRAAYNTDKYGIRAVPLRTSTFSGGTTFTDETWGIIARLRDRTLTGGAMHTAIADHIERLTGDSAQLFQRILLKDMRAGFSAETCNKVWPGLVPDTAYMRCSLPKDAKPEAWTEWEDGEILQIKADGMFVNIDHEDTGEVFMYSRAGTMFPTEAFGQLLQDIHNTFPMGTQSHGEMLVERDGKILAREIGNGILNKVAQGGAFAANERPVFEVWDQIPLECAVPKGKCETPYIDRLRAIIGQLKGKPQQSISLITTKIVKSLDEAYSIAGGWMASGLEGGILKRRTAIWKDGTSKEQVKLKLEFEVDLEIVGFVAGRDNTKNAGRVGSLTCRSSCGNLEVDVAIKGEAMRDAVDADKDGWLGKIMPVTANMIMKPSESNPLHSLFLPRFTSATPRTDKFTADSLERAFAIEAAAKLGKKLKDESIKEAA